SRPEKKPLTAWRKFAPDFALVTGPTKAAERGQLTPFRPGAHRARQARVRFLHYGPTLPGRRFAMTTRSWIRNPFASRKPRTIRKAPARSRPTVEILEDRMAPATLTVNTLGDNSNADTGLSLREAILLVNNAGNAQAALGRSLSSEEAALVNSS